MVRRPRLVRFLLTTFYWLLTASFFISSTHVILFVLHLRVLVNSSSYRPSTRPLKRAYTHTQFHPTTHNIHLHSPTCLTHPSFFLSFKIQASSEQAPLLHRPLLIVLVAVRPSDVVQQCHVRMGVLLLSSKVCFCGDQSMPALQSHFFKQVEFGPCLLS